METIHTVESLVGNSRNTLYHHEHRVNENDALFCNLYTNIIHVSRRNWQPVAGDQLIYKGKQVHIDEVEAYTQIDLEKPAVGMVKLGICHAPMTPFIRAKIGDSTASISLSTSGGPWESIQIERSKLSLHSQQEKYFCFFGHSGACGNGAIDFPANVNVWEIKE